MSRTSSADPAVAGTTRAGRWLLRRLAGLFRRRKRPPSETSRCPALLARFCTGYGVDLGFGGDPIVEHAIGMDLPNPYARHTARPVQLGGSADDLYWFRDGVLDFVYSSHLLEDLADTEAVLREWLRVLKPGGRLVLYCPDEVRYRAFCSARGEDPNPHHQFEGFSLEWVKRILVRLGQREFVHEDPDVDDYSWELVCVKSPESI